MVRDLKFAVRGLARARLLTLTSVVTLALGIGLAVGVFAVVYGVLLRPLPYEDPSRVVVIALRYADSPEREAGIPREMVEEWRRRSRSFASLAGYATGDFTVRGAGEPRSVRTTMVSDGFFETLRLPAHMGSTAQLGGGRPIAAMSRRLADRLGTPPTVTLASTAFSVGGVLRREFTFPADTSELWVHADAVPRVTLFSTADNRDFFLVARLAPGVTRATAQADAERVAMEINADLTVARRRYPDVCLLQDHIRRDVRGTLLPFAAGAVLVLLMACANVSGLLVGRAASRQREFAVRRAIGGDTRHVLRAALTENTLIALGGWLLGLWIADLVLRGFAAFGVRTIPNLQAARLDLPVVAASLVLALLVAVASGIGPALRASRANPETLLRRTSDRAGRGASAARGGLVVAQIALTVVLLVSAGLLMQTVVRVLSAERGFDADRVVAMQLMLTETTRFMVTERAPFLDRLAAETRNLPGVVAAGIGSDLPPTGTQLRFTVRIIRDRGEETLAFSLAAVTPGYLEAVGAELVSGRFFDERDRGASPFPVVLSETAVKTLMPEQDPIGREWPVALPRGGGKRERPRIVGVVRDLRFEGLDRPASPTIFLPWEALGAGRAHLVVRAAGDVAAVRSALPRVIQQLDPSLPLFPVQSLDDVVHGSIADRRLRLDLAIVFAALALLLATIALWGAVAQAVLDRRRELAIRMALGATSTDAVRLIVRWGGVLVAIGVMLGAAGAAASARTLRHLLVDVTPFDPLMFAAGSGLAALVSLVACYVPARRAATISPSELLRDA